MKPTRIAAIALLLAGSAAWSQPPDPPASADQASEEPSPQQPPPEDAQDPQPAEVHDDQQPAEPATNSQAEVQDDQQPAEPATNPQAADVDSVHSDQMIDASVLRSWDTWGSGHYCFPDTSTITLLGPRGQLGDIGFTVGRVLARPTTGTYQVIRAGLRGSDSYIEFSTSRDQNVERLLFRTERRNGQVTVVLRGRYYPGGDYQIHDYNRAFAGQGTPCHDEQP